MDDSGSKRNLAAVLDTLARNGGGRPAKLCYQIGPRHPIAVVLAVLRTAVVAVAMALVVQTGSGVAGAQVAGPGRPVLVDGDSALAGSFYGSHGGLALAPGVQFLRSSHPGQVPQTPASHSRRGRAAHTPPSAEGRPLDPSVFAPGSCEEFGPSTGNAHQVVFLDAGHGGVDPGAVGTTGSGQTITEASLTLPVELDTMRLLRAQGYTVVVSRTTDSTVLKLSPDDFSNGVLSLQGVLDEVGARDRCANLAHADVLIGIYFDAGDGPGYAGCLTGYDTARPFAAANKRLAQLVQTDVLGAMNGQGWSIPDDGTVTDDGLGSRVPTDSTGGLAAKADNYDHLFLLGPYETGYQTDPSQMPGVVVEPLYLTDPFEGSIAASQTGQQVIAQGLAKAAEQSLSLLDP